MTDARQGARGRATVVVEVDENGLPDAEAELVEVTAPYAVQPGVEAGLPPRARGPVSRETRSLIEDERFPSAMLTIAMRLRQGRDRSFEDAFEQALAGVDLDREAFRRYLMRYMDVMMAQARPT